MNNSIPYGRQSITDEDIKIVIETLKSDYLTQGPKIVEFEKKFAEYVGAKYAVAVNNATAGLHLSTIVLGVKPGDKVIVTPLTFAASANCVRFCGGEVVFCDIDKDTYLMDINKLKTILSASPKGTYKGVIPVDFAGYPVNLDEFRKIADEYGLWIIEDACHAPGGYFYDSKEKKQFCGNGVYADIAVFSFHPVKHIATGEGGMITTNSKELYDTLCLYRTHGITKDSNLLHEDHGGWYYEMQELGFNYRITDFQAALGISQLSRANAGLDRRQEIVKQYNDAFKDIVEVKTPYLGDGCYNAHHLYIIQVQDRLGLYNFLRDNKIYAQIHYVPLHLMPYYQQFGCKKGDFPVVEKYYEHCLSLPMYPTLTNEEVEYVIGKIKQYLEKIVKLKFKLELLSENHVTLEYVSWLNNYDVVQYTESRHNTHTLESVLQFVKSVTNENNRAYAIIDIDNKKHIGNVKIGSIDRQHLCADVGLIIGDVNYWGKGVATKVLQMVTDIAFQELHLCRLYAGIYGDNISSQKAFEKAGWSFESIQRKNFLLGGEMTDYLLYSIINE